MMPGAELQSELQRKDHVIADLRRQVSTLLHHSLEATALKQKLNNLDSKVTLRDNAHLARNLDLNNQIKILNDNNAELQLKLQHTTQDALLLKQSLDKQMENLETARAQAVERAAALEEEVTALKTQLRKNESASAMDRLSAPRAQACSDSPSQRALRTKRLETDLQKAQGEARAHASACDALRDELASERKSHAAAMVEIEASRGLKEELEQIRSSLEASMEREVAAESRASVALDNAAAATTESNRLAERVALSERLVADTSAKDAAISDSISAILIDYTDYARALQFIAHHVVAGCATLPDGVRHEDHPPGKLSDVFTASGLGSRADELRQALSEVRMEIIGCLDAVTESRERAQRAENELQKVALRTSDEVKALEEANQSHVDRIRAAAKREGNLEKEIDGARALCRKLGEQLQIALKCTADDVGERAETSPAIDRQVDENLSSWIPLYNSLNSGIRDLVASRAAAMRRAIDAEEQGAEAAASVADAACLAAEDAVRAAEEAQATADSEVRRSTDLDSQLRKQRGIFRQQKIFLNQLLSRSEQHIATHQERVKTACQSLAAALSRIPRYANDQVFRNAQHRLIAPSSHKRSPTRLWAVAGVCVRAVVRLVNLKCNDFSQTDIPAQSSKIAPLMHTMRRRADASRDKIYVLRSGRASKGDEYANDGNIADILEFFVTQAICFIANEETQMQEERSKNEGLRQEIAKLSIQKSRAAEKFRTKADAIRLAHEEEASRLSHEKQKLEATSAAITSSQKEEVTKLSLSLSKAQSRVIYLQERLKIADSELEKLPKLRASLLANETELIQFKEYMQGKAAELAAALEAEKVTSAKVVSLSQQLSEIQFSLSRWRDRALQNESEMEKKQAVFATSELETAHAESIAARERMRANHLQATLEDLTKRIQADDKSFLKHFDHSLNIPAFAGLRNSSKISSSPNSASKTTPNSHHLQPTVASAVRSEVGLDIAIRAAPNVSRMRQVEMQSRCLNSSTKYSKQSSPREDANRKYTQSVKKSKGRPPLNVGQEAAVRWLHETISTNYKNHEKNSQNPLKEDVPRATFRGTKTRASPSKVHFVQDSPTYANRESKRQEFKREAKMSPHSKLSEKGECGRGAAYHWLHSTSSPGSISNHSDMMFNALSGNASKLSSSLKVASSKGGRAATTHSLESTGLSSEDISPTNILPDGTPTKSPASVRGRAAATCWLQSTGCACEDDSSTKLSPSANGLAAATRWLQSTGFVSDDESVNDFGDDSSANEYGENADKNVASTVAKNTQLKFDSNRSRRATSENQIRDTNSVSDDGFDELDGEGMARLLSPSIAQNTSMDSYRSSENMSAEVPSLATSASSHMDASEAKVSLGPREEHSDSEKANLAHETLPTSTPGPLNVDSPEWQGSLDPNRTPGRRVAEELDNSRRRSSSPGGVSRPLKLDFNEAAPRGADAEG